MLDRPLWPGTRFSLTTPLSLLLAAVSVAIGLPLYHRGFTYEGSVLVYMLPAVFIAWPYYSARYTWCMTWLVLMSFVPMSIWLQNKGVETLAWYYRPPDGYLVWITRPGEGWGLWTRHLWLGNDMPAMEYGFYPLFCLFQVTLYSLFFHLLPHHCFEQERRGLKWIFPVLFPLLMAGFTSLYFLYSKPGQTNYVYWLTAIGYVLTAAAYVISPSYRTYTRSPAYWIWFVGMGALFMPLWEIFHCCMDHDWVYDPAHNYPFVYSFNGAGFAISEPFGYLTTATTFQALMMLLIRRFGHIVIKERQLVPFGRYDLSHRPTQREP